jgi:putative addiction module killer protein
VYIDMKTNFEIIIYETAQGKEPFNDWLNSLDGSVLGKVQARIDRLQDGQFGNAKALKDGLFELKFKNPAFRIYYALIGKKIILLISGGDKSHQSDDIKKSKEYLSEYRRIYAYEKK